MTKGLFLKLQQFAGRAAGGRARRGALLLISGTVAGQGLALLAAPLLTRLYSVEDFGNLRSYISILAFGAVLAAARFETTILMVEDDRDAAAMVLLSLGIVLVTSLLTFVILLAITAASLVPESLLGVQRYFWVVPLSTVGAGAYLVASQWSLRRKEFKEVAATKLTQTVGQVVTQLCLGALWHAGLPGLLAGDVLGRAGGSFRLLKNAWRTHKSLFLEATFLRVRQLAVRYRSFSLVSSASTLLNTAGSQVPTFLIGGFFGVSVLGWYALVDRFMNVPCAIVGQAVSQVYISGASDLARSNPSQLRSMYLRQLRQLALLGAIPFLLVFLFSPWAFAKAFGQNWEEAGHYARILAPMNYVSFVVWPFMSTLNLLERQSWQLVWDVARLIVSAGGLVWVHFVGGDGRMCVGAISVALLVAYAAHALMSYYAICREID